MNLPTYFIFIICLFSTCTLTAQDTLFTARFTSNGNGYLLINQSCQVQNGIPLHKGDVAFVVDVLDCKNGWSNQRYFEVINNRNRFFVRNDGITGFDPTESILKLMKTGPFKERLLANSFKADSIRVIASNIVEKKLKDRLNKSLNEKKLKGIILEECRIFDESSVTEGMGLSLVVRNTSVKTIKYVLFNVVGYNPVNDKVVDPLKRTSIIKLRCIGPIKPNRIADYSFNYVWFTDIVETFKISSMSVQYMDNSIKVISSPNNQILSDLERDLIH